MTTWRNWGGNQQAQPRAIETPRDVEEVALLVKRAAGDGQRVKAAGALSYTLAARKSGMAIFITSPVALGPERALMVQLLEKT